VQRLHLVGFTTDHQGLIFSVRRGAKSGTYVVPLDERLLEVIEDYRNGPDDPADSGPKHPEGGLTVREIQARLRRGRTIAEVAQAAGREESWIARFAPPVFAEQAEVIRAVREARASGSETTTRESLYRDLADRGVEESADELDEKWRARHLHDHVWLVTFRHTWQGRDHESRWEVDEDTGTVRAVEVQLQLPVARER
jgi:hypothetical protein